MMSILMGAVLALGLVVFSLFVALMWRRVVPNNMVDIVQSRKKTTSYGHKTEVEDEEGNKKTLTFAGNVYYKFPPSLPFIGVSVIQLPLSNFDINLNSYSAYDKDRLPFDVDITAFFRIHDPEVAARRISNFAELQTHLTEILKGTVRRVLAINNLEHIMEDRAGLGEKFTTEVKEQLAEWGVTTVKMIEFMDIRDGTGSQVIQNIMAKEKSRIEKESRITVADNMQLAETKEIEAKRTIETSRIDAEQQVGLREAEKEQLVGIAKEKSFQEVQVEKKVSTERDMEVRKVVDVKTAEISRDVAVVKADEEQKVLIVNAEAQTKKQVIEANGIKDSEILKAEGKLQATLKDSEGITAIGAAEAEAERLKLHAPVSAQLELAREIGENDNYQSYLVAVRKVEASEVVGKEMATALAQADLKVIANGGDINGGLTAVTDLFSAKGGTALAGMIEGFVQSETGKALTDKIIGEPENLVSASKKKLTTQK